MTWSHLHIRAVTIVRFAVALFFGLSAPAITYADRLALVLGNGDYTSAPHLANSVNDATAVADALKRLGFTVTLMTDAGGESLWTEMDKFVASADKAESVVFYYSGHAFQMNGVNYLVPVSAKLDSREGAKKEAWALDGIIARLQSRNRQTLLFLDACRNDPLPSSVRGSGAAAGGLARVQAGVGTFVAFSTAPGDITVDGVAEAKHSPFTSALLAHLEEPGISISDMMIEVRNDVENATLRKQVPWDQSSLREQFYFVPQADVAKQELSEADYELLAQLDPADRKKFMDLLVQSGFDAAALAKAETAISISEANLVQVASESTILSGPEASDATDTVTADATPQLEVLDATVTIGSAPDEQQVAALEPGNSVEPDGTIRLAALNWTTRDIAINEVTAKRQRVEGRVLSSDNAADREIMAAIDPALLETSRDLTLSAGDLARAVQSELKRVGCYQIGVDGSWGKGSRTALTSYYLAKRKVPDNLEPTDTLYAALTNEDQVVCAARVASSAVKTGVRTVTVAVEAPVATSKKVDMKSKAKTGKKQETAKTRIIKGTIGMTGAF